MAFCLNCNRPVKIKTILTSGKDRTEALLSLAQKLEAGKADILILFFGADTPADEAEVVYKTLEKQFPRTEAILLDGGQPIYDYILVLC